MNWIDIAIYAADIAIAAGVFFALIYFGRKHYANLISVNKHHPNGQIVCEFWPESGRRYYKLLPVEANGMEVKSPKGHKCPRYFFNKSAMHTTQWPMDQLFKTLGVAVDAPIVSWPENSPEPIVPSHIPPIATSTMLGSIGDDDFLAFAMAANKEIEELQRALAKALASSVSKGTFIAVGIALAVLTAGGIYLAYMSYSVLQRAWW